MADCVVVRIVRAFRVLIKVPDCLLHSLYASCSGGRTSIFSASTWREIKGEKKVICVLNNNVNDCNKNDNGKIMIIMMMMIIIIIIIIIVIIIIMIIIIIIMTIIIIIIIITILIIIIIIKIIIMI